MSVDVVGLRALAEKATPGPWTWWNLEQVDQGWTDNGPNLETVERGPRYPDGSQGAAEVVVSSWGHDANGINVSDADAEFIAAASPDVVLALLDEITTLRAEVADRDARIEEALNEARASSVPLGMPEVAFYRAVLRTVEATLSVPAVPVPQDNPEANTCLDCGRSDGGCDRIADVRPKNGEKP